MYKLDSDKVARLFDNLKTLAVENIVMKRTLLRHFSADELDTLLQGWREDAKVKAEIAEWESQAKALIENKDDPYSEAIALLLAMKRNSGGNVH